MFVITKIAQSGAFVKRRILVEQEFHWAKGEMLNVCES